MSTAATAPAHRHRQLAGWTLRVATAGLLAVDVQVHAHLARQAWQGWHPVTPAQLFAAEAAGAAAAALALLVSARAVVWAAAALIGFVGVAAVLLTYYVDIPALGPIPSMYEPVWSAAKTWSAIAEALATVLALYGLHSYRARRPAAGGPLPSATGAARPAVTTR